MIIKEGITIVAGIRIRVSGAEQSRPSSSPA
jgi:hypothetical protein